MIERWKPIDGHEGYYEISDLGRIRSVDRTITDTRGRSYNCIGMVRANAYDRNGYAVNNLRGKNYRVHRLVAQAFIENPQNLPQVNHKDHDKKNNAWTNLEWCTNLENARHAHANGRGFATQNPKRAKKLTAQQVAQIREAYAQGEKQGALAKRFGVVNQMVSNIVRNVSWRVA